MAKKKNLTVNEINQKIKNLREKLSQLQEVKRLMAEENEKPDQDMKIRESRLIQQILGYEKDLDRGAPRQNIPKKPMKKKFSKKKKSTR